LHASLLPRYRGAAPINWAIINGEKETGLTIIKMNDKMDSGEIILQKKIDIDNVDTAVSLEEKLAREGADLLLECIDKIEKNNFQLLPQDEAGVSFAPKLKKKDGLINWHAPAEGVQNLIRGTFDWPGAFTYYNGKLLKIFKAYVYRFKDLPASRIAGEIIKVSREGIIVATGSDNLIIEELQIEGGRRMRVEEFISGHKIYPQERFSSVP
jgi:methionyl-tRNA formyltransferase